MVYSIKGQGGALWSESAGEKKEDQGEEFIIFNQQFLTLIKAGLPILKSLDLLARRQRNAYFKAVLAGRTAKGEEAAPCCLTHLPAQGNMSKIYTTTLLAGERSGNLEEVLGRYITFQRIAMTFRKKLLSSLWYPALLFVALGVMLTFLMTYVVPQFADLYSSLDAKLPASTVFMLGVGKAIQELLLLDICSMIAVVVGFWFGCDLKLAPRTLDSLRYKCALVWPGVDEISGRHVQPHTFYAPLRRPSPGSIPGDREPVHQQLQGC